MIKIIKKMITLVLFLCLAQFFSPSVSPAARVAGDDVPAPTIAPSVPGASVLPLKRQEKKDAPSPSPDKVEKTEAPVSGKVKPEETTAPVKTPGAAVPSSTVSATKKQVQDARHVTIDFDNVDIQVFVKFVSELTGKNFVIDDKVKGKVTIISPRKISIDEVYKVFESVLEVYGFATVTAGDVIKIVPSLQAREKQLETRVGKEQTATEDRLVTQIISLGYANPDDVKRVLDPLISRNSLLLSYPPTGMLVITDYLSNIQRIMEIIGALDVEGVAAQLTYLPLKAASAAEIVKSVSQLFLPQTGRPAASPVRIVADERANALILVASEMDTDRIKKLIALMDKEVPKGDAMLRVYRLQNAVAEDLAKVLMNIPKAAATPTPAPAQSGKSPLLSKDVQVLADKATNTLIITAGKDDYKVLEDVIQSLDVSRPMVYIEALIMEVNVTKKFQVGVEWRGLFGSADLSSNLGPDATGVGMVGFSGQSIIPQLDSSGVPIIPGGFSLGVIGAGIKIGGVSFPNIGAVLQAYQNDSDVSILSTPQIMTLDNEEAEINVGSNVPYLTRQDTSSGQVTSAGGINYSSYEYKDVGVTLNITPHINAEDFVRLKLNQKVSKVTTGADIARPTTLKREAKTTVVVKDKETIVIGGLLGDSTDVGTSGVPCLSSIPVMGWLFKSVSRAREKTNLYVFITPHIIRTQKDAADLYKEKRDSMGEVVEGVIKLNERAAPKALDGESGAKKELPAKDGK